MITYTVTVGTVAEIVVPVSAAAGSRRIILRATAGALRYGDSTVTASTGTRLGARSTYSAPIDQAEVFGLNSAAIWAVSESGNATLEVTDQGVNLLGSQYFAAAATDVVNEFWVAGDAYPQLRQYADGLTQISNGTVVPAATSSGDWSEPLEAGGQALIPRLMPYTSSATTLTTQVCRFTFFRACRTETVSTAYCVEGNTAAAATPTLVRFGLYTEAANGALTLVASTTNDTALFSGSVGSLVTKALSTPYLLQRGVRYAYCWLVVTAVAAPTVVGAQLGSAVAGFSTAIGLAPRRAASLSAQSDLPAGPVTITTGNDTSIVAYTHLI